MSKLFFEMTETEAQLQNILNSLEYAQYQMSTGINGYGNGTMTREEHQETERSVLSSLGVAMSGVQKLIGEYASLEEGELLPEMEKADKIVEHPVYGSEDAVDKMQRYKKIKSEYQKYYGKIPTDREMSAFMGTDEESLKSIKKAAAMGQIRSLDEPINSEGEDIYIGDTIASKEDVEAEVIDRIDSDRMSRELWTAVDRLPDLQGKVLRCRFLEKKTYQQTGETLGISVSAVRQQQDKAMRLLRNIGRNKGFIGYREEFLPAVSIHVGVRSFQYTWTSEVEREALRF